MQRADEPMEPANGPVAFVHYRVEARIRSHAGQGIDHVIRLLVIQMSVFHPKIGDLRSEAPRKSLLDLGGPLLAHFAPAVAIGLVRRGADALIRRQIHGPGEPRVGRLRQIETVAAIIGEGELVADLSVAIVDSRRPPETPYCRATSQEPRQCRGVDRSW